MWLIIHALLSIRFGKDDELFLIKKIIEKTNNPFLASDIIVHKNTPSDVLDLAARKFADISYHYKKEHILKNDYLYSKELIPDKYKIYNDIIKINSLDPLTTISSHPNTKKETLEYILSIYPSDNYLAYASIIEQRKDEEWKLSIIDWPPPKRLINNPSNKYVQKVLLITQRKK